MDISVNILNNIIAGKRLLKLKYLTLSKNNLIKAVFSGVNWNKLINL